jgi:hypothetical protein
MFPSDLLQELFLFLPSLALYYILGNKKGECYDRLQNLSESLEKSQFLFNIYELWEDYINIVKYSLKRDLNFRLIDTFKSEECIYSICKEIVFHGNQDILKIIEIKCTIPYDKLAIYAVECGHESLFWYLFNKLDWGTKSQITSECVKYALRHDFDEIFALYPSPINLSDICYNKDEKVVLKLLNYFKYHGYYNSLEFLLTVIQNGHINVIKKFIPECDNNIHLDIITYIKDHETMVDLLNLIEQYYQIDYNSLAINRKCEK